MAIDKDKISEKIIRKLPKIKIATKVGNDDSQTVELIRIIVDEIVNEIVSNGEVIVIEANSNGIGYAGTPVSSKLVGFGKGKIV